MRKQHNYKSQISQFAALLFFFVATGAFAQSTNPQLQLTLGFLGVRSIAGCCTSSSPELASSISVRLPKLIENRDIEIAGASTGKYSEFSVGPSFYMLGEEPQEDPSSGMGTTVVRVSDWTVLGSTGLGFVIHSTRTKDLDLPAIVVGMLVYFRVNAIYAFNDQWSLGMQFSSSVGIAQNYFTVSYFTGLGPRYRF